ncbi:heme biosynthesis HemY N-terminal domain-containing protein [Nitrosospira multiformis]|uniref:HemY protein n=1 Tax=Nitrosospira multiformis TaxID=1231 RepID=A0A1I7HMT9_9PROT|nr:heme biosynthesis HemY N-terminal domain-containing protein [Nitrosospira multiformis]SFU62050.1 HemY protein [Nitrosospira multiformis]
MKGALWLLALFMIAVAVTIAATYNSGYVLIVAQPYRIELSLNLLVLLLLVVISMGYLGMRLIVFTARLPAELSEFRTRRRREKALEGTLDGLKAFFERRYAKAEKSAAAALKMEDSAVFSAINAIVAARSAHGLRNYSRRDEFIAQAETSAPQEVALRLMTQAELLLDEHRPEEALELLHRLPSGELRRHTGALKLELEAQQNVGNWDVVLELLSQLEQRDGPEASLIKQLRCRAHIENLRSRMLNPGRLKEYWEGLSPSEKKDGKVAAVAARGFSATGDCAMVHHLVEQSLESQWDSELAKLYAECIGSDPLRQIERAEAWLEVHPNDASLLLALGKLCVQAELWGKAQSYLEASLSVKSGYAAHLALGRLNEKLGQPELAREHYGKGLELAVRQLETAAMTKNGRIMRIE